MQNKKIAIVADWLIDFGGAELVISHLLELFPEADIYTSVCFMDHPMLQGRRIYTSWLQRVPFLNRRHKLAGILRPFAFRSFDLSGYDIIISSSSAEAKQVAMGKWNASPQPSPKGEGVPKLPFSEGEGVGGGGKIICYCHTPTRYYWSHYEEYRNMMEFGFLNPLARFVLDRLINWLRKLDYESAQRVDFFIANSSNTRERIQKYYNRESEVIYPGVSIPLIRGTQGVCSDNVETNPPTPLIRGASETESISVKNSQKNPPTPLIRESQVSLPLSEGEGTEGGGEYYLGIGRCIPYKKFDLLVDAFNQNGKKLILCTATDTPLFRQLKEISKPNIEWKYRVSNEEKNSLMANAKAFLFPPLEDFGLVPIEAMALGTPVIAYGKGGALETVIDGETGIFFDSQTPLSLNNTIEKFETLQFDKEKIRKHAAGFSKEVFQGKIIEFITKNRTFSK